MKIGIFEIKEPLPNLKNPHAVAVLRPWTDAGNSATLAVAKLETQLKSKEIGKISMPGMFYDFSRYRPVIFYRHGVRDIIIPNTVITYCRRESGNDLVFLNMLEPLMFGEIFVESVNQLIKKLGVQRYVQFGSMYDMVPHSRPLPVSGGSSNPAVQEFLSRLGARQGRYEGPTSICSLIPMDAVKAGIETANVMVRLPQYTELEEDYNGQVRLLEMFRALYGVPIEDSVLRRAEKQTKEISAAVGRSSKLKEIVFQLEVAYDAQQVAKQDEELPKLSPDIEDFLKEMEKRFKQN